MTLATAIFFNCICFSNCFEFNCLCVIFTKVGELNQSLAQLKARLANTNDSLKGLTRNQLDLEDDINVKGNTLFIDEVECMGMRKSINIQQF